MSFLTDLRLALRGLVKQPRFTTVAALTLALGIGSVTAIFSVVNGILLTPLPYPHADRLVNIWSHAPGLGLQQFPLSPDLFFFFKKESRSFEDMTTFQRRGADLTESANPESVRALLTTAAYFGTLGIAPARGQVYTGEQDKPGGPKVAVISDRLWQRRFGGKADAIGSSIQIDGEATTILGVLPAALDESESPDLWMPARLDSVQPPAGNFGWNVIGRLRPGIAVTNADTELNGLMKRMLDSIQGNDYRAFLTQGKYTVTGTSVRDDIIGDVQQPLWILLGTVGFILLIACANVANLFLVRAESRQREVAVRAALGATRGTLVRGQLAEAGALAIIGGGLGVLVAALGVPALVRLAPTSIPRLNTIGLDGTVLAVAAATTAVAALLFGLVPAIRYTRRAAMGTLKQGRGSTADKSRHRGRRALVVLQTAMTRVLLVGSGLLIRSFARMLDTDLGFSTADVLTFRVAPTRASYPDRARELDFDKRLLERLSAIPGVQAVGATSTLPMNGGTPGTAFVAEGKPTPPGQLPPIVHYTYTTPGYIETMRMKVVKGRSFEPRDAVNDVKDVIINEATAKTYWPGEDPIGKRIRPNGAPPDFWLTVVGVVANERRDGLRRESPLTLFYPIGAPGQDGVRALSFVVRGPGATDRASAVRDAVWALNPRMPVAAIRSMDEVVSRAIVPFRFTMLTLCVAAAMALLLGMIGLYGVLSYTVTLRFREIGVRLALGAAPGRVLRSVVLQGLVIVGIGLAIGIGAATGLTRFLGDLLYGTKPLDVLTFTSVSLGLLMIAALASYFPARRAASISPMESLKNE